MSRQPPFSTQFWAPDRPSSSKCNDDQTNQTPISFAEKGHSPRCLPAFCILKGDVKIINLEDEYGTTRKTNATKSCSVREYVAASLDVSRLEKIEDHLWLAGQKRPPRALHEQVALGRNIVVAEDAAIHLLWNGPRISIKPLPWFLLDADFWRRHICNDKDLYPLALGFLRSYIHLIRNISDLRIALKEGLLPEGITWNAWVEMSHSTLSHLNTTEPPPTHHRYEYGELRLGRINWIWRWHNLQNPPRKGLVSHLTRGYDNQYHDYGSFLSRNMTPIATCTAYVILVLESMQVGLNTAHLQASSAYQAACWGLSVFAIVGPLAATVLVFVILVVILINNLLYTLYLHRERNREKADSKG